MILPMKAQQARCIFETIQTRSSYRRIRFRSREVIGLRLVGSNRVNSSKIPLRDLSQRIPFSPFPSQFHPDYDFICGANFLSRLATQPLAPREKQVSPMAFQRFQWFEKYHFLISVKICHLFQRLFAHLVVLSVERATSNYFVTGN